MKQPTERLWYYILMWVMISLHLHLTLDELIFFSFLFIASVFLQGF